jgi:hypothetical protein
MVGNLHQWLID